MRIVNPISRQLPPQPSENDDEFIAAASMAAEEEYKKNINKIKYYHDSDFAKWLKCIIDLDNKNDILGNALPTIRQFAAGNLPSQYAHLADSLIFYEEDPYIPTMKEYVGCDIELPVLYTDYGYRPLAMLAWAADNHINTLLIGEQGTYKKRYVELFFTAIAKEPYKLFEIDCYVIQNRKHLEAHIKELPTLLEKEKGPCAVHICGIEKLDLSWLININNLFEKNMNNVLIGSTQLTYPELLKTKLFDSDNVYYLRNNVIRFPSLCELQINYSECLLQLIRSAFIEKLSPFFTKKNISKNEIKNEIDAPPGYGSYETVTELIRMWSDSVHEELSLLTNSFKLLESYTWPGNIAQLEAYVSDFVYTHRFKEPSVFGLENNWEQVSSDVENTQQQPNTDIDNSENELIVHQDGKYFILQLGSEKCSISSKTAEQYLVTFLQHENRFKGVHVNEIANLNINKLFGEPTDLAENSAKSELGVESSNEYSDLGEKLSNKRSLKKIRERMKILDNKKEECQNRGHVFPVKDEEEYDKLQKYLDDSIFQGKIKRFDSHFSRLVNRVSKGIFRAIDSINNPKIQNHLRKRIKVSKGYFTYLD